MENLQNYRQCDLDHSTFLHPVLALIGHCDDQCENGLLARSFSTTIALLNMSIYVHMYIYVYILELASTGNLCECRIVVSCDLVATLCKSHLT